MTGKRAIWSRSGLTWWQEKAADANLPYWFRTAALAYGLHGTNGHAPLKHGDLSLMLGTVDPQTGEWVRYRRGAQAVRAAVEAKLLDPASSTRCLVVPPGGWKQGFPGQWPQCPVHGNTVPTSASLSDALRGPTGAQIDSLVPPIVSLSDSLAAWPLLPSVSALQLARATTNG